ncbi:DUF4826 family protein [Pseudomonadales bacterium]|nr:DUF4826 family protein [Pseudomonadales bacterium]
MMPAFDEEAFQQWSKRKLDQAVEELIQYKVFDTPAIQARVVWGITDNVLLAQVQEGGHGRDFRWLITGEDYPTDHVPASVAKQPRLAARHFSLKWQLGAERVQDLPPGARANIDPKFDLKEMSEALSDQAMRLYDLVENDALWPKT